MPLIFLTLFLVSTLVWAQEHPCPCDPRTEPSSFSDRLQQPTDGVDFEWFSDADKYQKESGRYCYERLVTNHHATAGLRFDWSVGRLKSENLAPNDGKARRCTYYGETTTRDGPLNYGRGNNKTQTKVWEGQNEPAPLPLTTIVQVDAVVKQQKWPVRLSLTSLVTKTGMSFTYTYRLNLEGDSRDASVDWHSAYSPRFNAALARTGRRTLIGLSMREPVTVVFESAEKPIVVDLNAEIYGPENTVLLEAGAAAYVPTK
jgi:hypothetical protein